MEDVRRDSQCKRRSVKDFSWVSFQCNMQVNGVSWEMGQMFFQLENFLPQLFSQHFMAVKILGDQIPRQFSEVGCCHGQLFRGLTVWSFSARSEL